MPSDRQNLDYTRFWAKTDRQSSEDNPVWHPLVCHGLDVAACGQVLLEGNGPLRCRLAKLSQIPEGDLLSWLTFLLSIHDIGKVADTFQALVPALFAWQKRLEPSIPYAERHDLMGWRLWQEGLLARLLPNPTIFPRANLQQETSEDWDELCEPWILAVMGHHGAPPRHGNTRQNFARLFPAPVLESSHRIVEDLAALLLPAGVPFPLEPPDEQRRRFQRASWPFAGLAVLADWLGSNREFFPFLSDLGMSVESLEPEDYWRKQALPGAREAVRRSGVLPLPPAPRGGLEVLFGHDRPTPLQSLAETLPLAQGPQLITIEEATGGGKTEAAVVLAHRLMAAEHGNGLYLALPTMATANAMYGRITRVYERLFSVRATPSLVLAHGRRHLFLALEQTPQEQTAVIPYGGEEPTGSQRCVAWLADSRKKALLAQVGVGTIDQALMAVLPLRHQSLRLAGLVGKVLLVDEVHACDAYISALLERLLLFHTALGGSAILLSATLPRSLRRKLRAAFVAGLAAGGYGTVEPLAAGEDYPLLTLTGVGHQAVERVTARREAQRRVWIHPLRSEAEVEAFLAETVTGGGCACWIRNTVADAQAAYERACGRYGRDRVTLFHSRFTVGDRARLEEAIVGRFGPESGPAERAGQLLIATQVVEQSLDLDFDRMVTDLCPIDLVLQRAGRLLRHLRHADGTRREPGSREQDGRGEAMLGLFGPVPEEIVAGDWYASVFPRGAFVYRDHGRLWLTARWLEERGGFRVPEESRELIEFVYGDGAEEAMPEALRESSRHAEGEDNADEYLGRQNALSFDRGYQAGSNQWPEDTLTPTRLGEPTVTLRLVRQSAGILEPWFQPTEERLWRHAWSLSEVSCRQALVKEEDLDPDDPVAVRLRAEMPDRGKYCLLVLLTPPDTGTVDTDARWTGTARNPDGRQVQIVYTRQCGLEIQ